MAGPSRNGQGSRRRKKLKYLFLNGELYRILHINRPADIVTMWSYPRHKRVGFTYSDVKKKMQRAFTTTEVATMLMRHKIILERAIWNGAIQEPQHTYGLTDVQQKYQYMWNEDNIMEMHDVLANTHRGRPRKDGLITPQKLPSAKEVRAMIRHDVVLYVQTDDGEFVPTWEAEQF